MRPLTVNLPAIVRQRSKRIINKKQEKSKSDGKSTSRVNAWRKKQKEDPEKAVEFKKKKQEQNRKYKEKLKRQKEESKEFHQGMKIAQRIWKQNSRARKRLMKENEEGKRIHDAEKVEKKQNTNTGEYICRPTCTTSTTRKRASRVNQIMPTSPKSWASTINHMLKNATPRRKSLVNTSTSGNQPGNSSYKVAKMMAANERGRPSKFHANVKKQLYFCPDAAQTLDINKYTINRYRKRQKIKKISKSKESKQQWYSHIIAFLDESSRVMPNKKDTVKIKGKVVAKRHLLMTKNEVYQNFLKKHPDYKSSFTTFYRLIPKNYRVLDEACRRVCVCMRCFNIEQKVEALSNATSEKFSVCDMSKLSLCPYDSMPERTCIDRICNNCGIKNIKTKFCTDEIDMNKAVSFRQWEKRKQSYVDRKGVKKDTIKWQQVQKTCTMKVLVDEVASDMTAHSAHIFRSDYQHRMQTDMIEHLPIDHCMVTMDFAENYALQSQDEIESAHWAQKQITIHPIFIIRHGPGSTTDKPIILKESLILITDDLNHNASTVVVFTNQLLAYLQNNPGPCDIQVIHRWSDNCAVQYKCVEVFSQLTQLEKFHNIRIVYHYTEAGHGKSQCDGVGGALKKRLDRKILSGQIINNAYEAYLALSWDSKEESHSRLLYLPANLIRKRAPAKSRGLKSLKGTQQFHQVKVLDLHRTILCQDLSCSCEICLGLASGPCYYGRFRLPEKAFNIDTGKIVPHLLPSSVPSVLDCGNDSLPSSSSSPERCPGSPTVEALVACDISCGDGDVLIASLESAESQRQEILESMSEFEYAMSCQHFLVQNVPRDGNCFFSSVCKQLQSKTPAELRIDLMRYMMELPQDKKQELEPFLTTTLTEYLQNMSQEGTYADHVVISCTADMIQRNITIMETNSQCTIGNYSGAPITVGYLRDSIHYVSLEPVRYHPGDFVGVRLCSKKKKEFYVAKVMRVEDLLELKFLREGPRNVYTWYQRPECFWHDKEDIIGKLPQPTLLPGRGIHMTFDLLDLDKCKKLLTYGTNK